MAVVRFSNSQSQCHIIQTSITSSNFRAAVQGKQSPYITVFMFSLWKTKSNRALQVHMFMSRLVSQSIMVQSLNYKFRQTFIASLHGNSSLPGKKFGQAYKWSIIPSFLAFGRTGCWRRGWTPCPGARDCNGCQSWNSLSGPQAIWGESYNIWEREIDEREKEMRRRIWLTCTVVLAASPSSMCAHPGWGCRGRHLC